jgi:hypothetical protein
MGFFSQECEGCHRSIIAPYVATRANAWQNEATVITASGTILGGYYDGYGNLGLDPLDQDGNNDPERAIARVIGETGPGGPTVWHTACWQMAGSPPEYRGPSERADDQGFFIDAADYDYPDPRIVRLPPPMRDVLRFAQLVQHFDSTRPSAN